MIVEPLDRAARLAAQGPQFARALGYLLENDFSRFALGRHEIDGEWLHAVIHEYDTRTPSDVLWETHRQHVDVQIVTAGRELVWWLPRGQLECELSYRDDTDAVAWSDPPVEPAATVSLVPGLVAVFFPGDAHKPCLHLDGVHAVRKVVVKVRVD